MGCLGDLISQSLLLPLIEKADAWPVWSVPEKTLNSRDHGLLRVDALPTQRDFGTRLVHWQGQGITRLAEHEVVPLHRCEQWRIRLGKYGNT